MRNRCHSTGLFLAILLSWLSPWVPESAASPSSAAKVLLSTPLLKDPTPGSPVLLLLKGGENVRVQNRKGDWVEVSISLESGDRRGWVQAHYLKDRGLPPAETRVRKPTGWFGGGGNGWGKRDSPDQYRVGLSWLRSFWQGVEFGGDLDIGFHPGTLISAGPLFVAHLGWPRWGTLQSAFFGGLRIAHLSLHGDRDLWGGVRLGIELGVPLMKVGSTKMDMTGRFGPELLLIGSSRVPISCIGSIGVSLRY